MSDASTNYSETPKSSPDDLLTTVKAALQEFADAGPTRLPTGINERFERAYIHLQFNAEDWLRALVAEVERLREQVDIMLEANADLAALREQRCETCQHSVRYTDNGSLYCYVLRNALNDVPCQLVGYRCGAWARREP